jgi:hypothetical protein
MFTSGAANGFAGTIAPFRCRLWGSPQQVFGLRLLFETLNEQAHQPQRPMRKTQQIVENV